MLLPVAYDVNLLADVNLGKIQVDGRDLGDGSDQSVDTFLNVDEERGTVNLDLDVGLGQITVNHVMPVRNGMQPMLGKGANS